MTWGPPGLRAWLEPPWLPAPSRGRPSRKGPPASRTSDLCRSIGPSSRAMPRSLSGYALQPPPPRLRWRPDRARAGAGRPRFTRRSGQSAPLPGLLDEAARPLQGRAVGSPAAGRIRRCWDRCSIRRGLAPWAPRARDRAAEPASRGSCPRRFSRRPRPRPGRVRARPRRSARAVTRDAPQGLQGARPPMSCLRRAGLAAPRPASPSACLEPRLRRFGVGRSCSSPDVVAGDQTTSASQISSRK